jgi:hypothetical protein
MRKASRNKDTTHTSRSLWTFSSIACHLIDCEGRPKCKV